MKSFRERWYDQKKIIPRDLKATAGMLGNWYLSDGYLKYEKKGKGYNRIGFAVHCFSRKEVEFLKGILRKKGFSPTSSKRERIYLNRQEEVKRFLNLISEYRIDCFDHKWVV